MKQQLFFALMLAVAVAAPSVRAQAAKDSGQAMDARILEDYYVIEKQPAAKWLVGSHWKATSEIVFNADQTFTIEGHLGTYRWQLPEFRKLILMWSNDEMVECSFDWAWSGIQERSGEKRLFKKVK